MYASTHIMVERGLNLKPISGLPTARLFPLQLTGCERLVRTGSSRYPVQTPVILSISRIPLVVHRVPFCRARARRILAGSQRAFTNSVWSCCRDRPPGFMSSGTVRIRLPQHNTPPSVVSSLDIFDVVFIEKARDVRFCLVTVIRGQKQVTCTMIIPMICPEESPLAE